MVNDKFQYFLLPPVRWALELRLLDANSINFKPPESLEMQAIDPKNIVLMHKKFVWKFCLILYFYMSKKLPFSFAEANGDSAIINSTTVKKFVELLRYKVDRPGGIEWSQNHMEICKCLSKGLTRSLEHRITFQDFYLEFTAIFRYYQPVKFVVPA